MTVYIALLRAVNVGGTGKLAMSDLKALCEQAGLAQVRTYIASGNVIFHSAKSQAQVKQLLEDALLDFTGKSVGVLVRTASEMNAVLAANPFPDKAGNRTVAIFLDEPPPANALELVSNQTTEVLQLGLREIYVHYGEGMADSKLKIPAARSGTARNMNTVAKLAAMALNQ